jgi:alpha-L-rhamnosidase
MYIPLISKPTFEHHHSGLGLSCSKPRISWQFLTAANENVAQDWVQNAYELEITTSVTKEQALYKVDSEQSILVSWPAAALSSRESASVRVRCKGVKRHSGSIGSASWTEWSEYSTVEIALLQRSDWDASFIASAQRHREGPLQPTRFRKDFCVPPQTPPSCKARLYITSLGVHEAYINGKPVSDACLAPGWTSYKHRLNYCVYDVTSLLSKDGANTICAEVAEGWYAGRLGFKSGKRFCYGEGLGLLAQLEITSLETDKSPFKLVSDDSWTCGPSAIQGSELYDGETFDARQDQVNWQQQSPPHFRKIPRRFRGRQQS